MNTEKAVCIEDVLIMIKLREYTMLNEIYTHRMHTLNMPLERFFSVNESTAKI